MVKEPEDYLNERDRVFDKINMVEWYKNFCANNHVERKKRFKDFSVEKIKEIFLELGYESKYYKSEHFFEVYIEKKSNIISHINFDFKYGLIEVIWVIERNSKEKDVMIASPLGVYIDRSIRPRKASFSSYAELKSILEEVIEKFKECIEEFKKEVL